MQPTSASLATTHSPPAADAVTYEWSRTFEAQPKAPQQLARLHTRTRLTMAHWRGNREAAAVVAGVLTANAVIHAKLARLVTGCASVFGWLSPRPVSS
ncbi:hypothetical protein QFZ82_001146 [Streptomyces sp. V4I23]|uniref:hypothetical protein n=1 Tax=Streptomyces sp. V4I23 TaxID=3042282 RepID=UPI002781A4DF|nr:hypothetical protein [Streptomyces sp. V4I23]MDQ1006661.1 hypothetical protein [Streptomyces sp. V4I23]